MLQKRSSDVSATLSCLLLAAKPFRKPLIRSNSATSTISTSLVFFILLWQFYFNIAGNTLNIAESSTCLWISGISYCVIRVNMIFLGIIFSGCGCYIYLSLPHLEILIEPCHKGMRVAVSFSFCHCFY